MVRATTAWFLAELAVVARLGGEPGDDRAMRKVFEPPLRQQRGFAEARRRLYDDRAAIAQGSIVQPQARPQQKIPGHSRRRDLQHEVGKRPCLGWMRGSCQRFRR